MIDFKTWKPKHKKATEHLSRASRKRTLCGRDIPKTWSEVEGGGKECGLCVTVMERALGVEEGDDFASYYDGAPSL